MVTSIIPLYCWHTHQTLRPWRPPCLLPWILILYVTTRRRGLLKPRPRALAAAPPYGDRNETHMTGLWTQRCRLISGAERPAGAHKNDLLRGRCSQLSNEMTSPLCQRSTGSATTAALRVDDFRARLNNNEVTLRSVASRTSSTSDTVAWCDSVSAVWTVNKLYRPLESIPIKTWLHIGLCQSKTVTRDIFRNV